MERERGERESNLILSAAAIGNQVVIFIFAMRCEREKQSKAIRRKSWVRFNFWGGKDALLPQTNLVFSCQL